VHELGEQIPMLVQTDVKKAGRPPINENQREVILESAAELFAQKGFDGASISDLAAAISLSKAAVYHYFPNKRQLCDAIIFQALARLVPRTKDEVAQASDPRDQLKSFMLCHADQFETNRYGIMTMLSGFDAMPEGRIKKEANRLRDEHEALLRQIIRQGIEQGVFVEVDVSMAGRAVLSMLNWMARWYRPEGRLSAKNIAAQYYEIICQGFVARP